MVTAAPAGHHQPHDVNIMDRIVHVDDGSTATDVCTHLICRDADASWDAKADTCICPQFVGKEVRFDQTSIEESH